MSISRRSFLKILGLGCASSAVASTVDLSKFSQPSAAPVDDGENPYRVKLGVHQHESAIQPLRLEEALVGRGADGRIKWRLFPNGDFEMYPTGRGPLA